MSSEHTHNEQVESPEAEAQHVETAPQETTIPDESVDELDTTDLASSLAAAQKEVVELKDQALRATAELQNVRRRAEQDVEKAHKFGVEKFANEMLPIVDNLERAIESCGDDEAAKAIREGVEMTLSMFLSGLEKFSIQQINPQGDVFDPALHQAMSMVDAPDAEPNTVVAVMQKGYSLSGRLMRPAMVMVAKS